jgi:hypothetical protein
MKPTELILVRCLSLMDCIGRTMDRHKTLNQIIRVFPSGKIGQSKSIIISSHASEIAKQID